MTKIIYLALLLFALHSTRVDCLFNEIASIIDLINKQFKPPESGCRNSTAMPNFDLDRVVCKHESLEFMILRSPDFRFWDDGTVWARIIVHK